MSEPMTATQANAAIDPEPRPAAQFFGRVLRWDSLGLVIVFALLYVVLSSMAPNFLTIENQLNIVRNAATFGICACAMTLVIVSGEIDVSIGSLAALSSSILGVLVADQHLPVWIAVIIVLLTGALSGAFAGAMRTYFGVPTFITTLALFLALRGLAQLITNNFPKPIQLDQFFYWGGGLLFSTTNASGAKVGLPVFALYFVIVAILVAIVARRTVFGRSVYAVGGNSKAATLSGISVRRTKISVMAISGVAAALTGLLQSANISSGSSIIAQGLEFDAIAAAIVGGTALAGGKGTITGTVIGVLFIAALLNGMVLLNVNPYAQQVVRGAVVLIAVLVNVWRTRRTASA